MLVYMISYVCTVQLMAMNPVHIATIQRINAPIVSCMTSAVGT